MHLCIKRTIQGSVYRTYVPELESKIVTISEHEMTIEFTSTVKNEDPISFGFGSKEEFDVCVAEIDTHLNINKVL